MEVQTSRIIPSDHPRSPRYKVFLVAEATFDGVSVRTHLLNISASGALAHSSTAPRSRSWIDLIYGSTRRKARVIWLQDQRYGIAFEVPLLAAELDMFLSAG